MSQTAFDERSVDDRPVDEQPDYQMPSLPPPSTPDNAYYVVHTWKAGNGPSSVVKHAMAHGPSDLRHANNRAVDIVCNRYVDLGYLPGDKEELGEDFTNLGADFIKNKEGFYSKLDINSMGEGFQQHTASRLAALSLMASFPPWKDEYSVDSAASGFELIITELLGDGSSRDLVRPVTGQKDIVAQIDYLCLRNIHFLCPLRPGEDWESFEGSKFDEIENWSKLGEEVDNRSIYEVKEGILEWFGESNADGDTPEQPLRIIANLRKLAKMEENKPLIEAFKLNTEGSSLAGWGVRIRRSDGTDSDDDGDESDESDDSNDREEAATHEETVEENPSKRQCGLQLPSAGTTFKASNALAPQPTADSTLTAIPAAAATSGSANTANTAVYSSTPTSTAAVSLIGTPYNPVLPQSIGILFAPTFAFGQGDTSFFDALSFNAPHTPMLPQPVAIPAAPAFAFGQGNTSTSEGFSFSAPHNPMLTQPVAIPISQPITISIAPACAFGQGNTSTSEGFFFSAPHNHIPPQPIAVPSANPHPCSFGPSAIYCTANTAEKVAEDHLAIDMDEQADESEDAATEEVVSTILQTEAKDEEMADGPAQVPTKAIEPVSTDSKDEEMTESASVKMSMLHTFPLTFIQPQSGIMVSSPTVINRNIAKNIRQRQSQRNKDYGQTWAEAHRAHLRDHGQSKYCYPGFRGLEGKCRKRDEEFNVEVVEFDEVDEDPKTAEDIKQLVHQGCEAQVELEGLEGLEELVTKFASWTLKSNTIGQGVIIPDFAEKQSLLTLAEGPKADTEDFKDAVISNANGQLQSQSSSEMINPERVTLSPTKPVEEKDIVLMIDASQIPLPGSKPKKREAAKTAVEPQRIPQPTSSTPVELKKASDSNSGTASTLAWGALKPKESRAGVAPGVITTINTTTAATTKRAKTKKPHKTSKIAAGCGRHKSSPAVGICSFCTVNERRSKHASEQAAKYPYGYTEKESRYGIVTRIPNPRPAPTLQELRQQARERRLADERKKSEEKKAPKDVMAASANAAPLEEPIPEEKTAVSEPISTVQEVKPVISGTKPVISASKPVIVHPKPVSDEPKPVPQQKAYRGGRIIPFGPNYELKVQSEGTRLFDRYSPPVDPNDPGSEKFYDAEEDPDFFDGEDTWYDAIDDLKAHEAAEVVKREAAEQILEAQRAAHEKENAYWRDYYEKLLVRRKQRTLVRQLALEAMDAKMSSMPVVVS